MRKHRRAKLPFRSPVSAGAPTVSGPQGPDRMVLLQPAFRSTGHHPIDGRRAREVKRAHAHLVPPRLPSTPSVRFERTRNRLLHHSGDPEETHGRESAQSSDRHPPWCAGSGFPRAVQSPDRADGRDPASPPATPPGAKAPVHGRLALHSWQFSLEELVWPSAWRSPANERSRTQHESAESPAPAGRRESSFRLEGTALSRAIGHCGISRSALSSAQENPVRGEPPEAEGRISGSGQAST